jgi:hypothetical protein
MSLVTFQSARRKLAGGGKEEPAVQPAYEEPRILMKKGRGEAKDLHREEG